MKNKKNKKRKKTDSEKVIFEEDDYEKLTKCPWCNSLKHHKWGEEVRGFKTVKCKNCGLIFVKNRLGRIGLAKYYKDYLNNVHQADNILNQQRNKMYKLEFELINRYAKKNSKVLDVGCSGGFFLDVFKKNGYQCYGVEFGKAAAREASKRHRVWQGELPDFNIYKKFDLIVFRGVIEHISYPKAYLEKAIALLKNYGLIYITSTPNSDASCCELFKENWNQHEPESHLMHFSPRHFDEYFKKAGVKKVTEHFFYKGTPYANIEQDVLRVAEAINLKRLNRKIDFKSPAFWGNMMSLIYQKQS
jgi:2-polyprenyl-3-methyl-5-hydroxy-6-metoxy-1,4-benzoquinol methylase